jgi:hypothetical protein
MLRKIAVIVLSVIIFSGITLLYHQVSQGGLTNNFAFGFVQRVFPAF